MDNQVAHIYLKSSSGFITFHNVSCRWMVQRSLLLGALVALVACQTWLIASLLWVGSSEETPLDPSQPSHPSDSSLPLPRHLSLVEPLSPSLARQMWPEEARSEEVCGNEWQDAYVSLHADLVSQAARGLPVRLAVFDCRLGGGGYADRLIGLMTTLLLAVMTDRALVVQWPGHDAVLRSPRIKLTALLRHAESARSSETRTLRWLQGNRLKLAELTDVDDLNKAWVSHPPHQPPHAPGAHSFLPLASARASSRLPIQPRLHTASAPISPPHTGAQRETPHPNKWYPRCCL